MVEEVRVVTQTDLEIHWRSIGKLEVTVVSCTIVDWIQSNKTTDDDGKRNVESALLTDGEFEAEREVTLVGWRWLYSPEVSQTPRRGPGWIRRVQCKQAAVSIKIRQNKSRFVKIVHPLTGE